MRVLGVPDELDGPLPAGSRVGTIVVQQRGRIVARVPLVTRRAIAAASVLRSRRRPCWAATLTVVILASSHSLASSWSSFGGARSGADAEAGSSGVA